MRLQTARALAAFSALTWWLFPGFGVVDLGVTWDPDWPVVLEATWGVFMTVLVGGAFAAVAAAPRRTAPAELTLAVCAACWLLAAAAGLEWQLLGYVVLLAVQAAALAALLPAREPVRGVGRSVHVPLLCAAAVGVVPWLVHAADVLADNRRGTGVLIGDVTMGVDHYAVQGALALALPVLTVLAALWPRGRRYLGISVGLCAGYVGLVSYAFPGTWAGFAPAWSVLAIAWAGVVATLAVWPRQVPSTTPVPAASTRTPSGATWTPLRR